VILVLVEPADGGASLLSLEALTFARELAADAPVHAVVVAGFGPDLLAELAAQGVAAVHHGDDPRLARYSGAAWAAAVGDVIGELAPSAVVAAASPRGNEILAHLAARRGLAMAANCMTATAEGGDGGGLLVRRQVMGGAALEELRLATADGAPALLTMAGHAVDPRPAPVPTSPTVRSFAPSLTDADLVAVVVRTEPVTADGAALTKARVVVGGGRGVGADGFGPLLELAGALGGALGVSRVVTSLGWRPHHEQVGQTGSRIAPDLYIACGISGAIQHWAGCSTAKTILAINTDADAPMVTKAHYAVIGDLHEVVPAITEELRARGG
jgi:electron transfer flavoprotein alpha subunit